MLGSLVLDEVDGTLLFDEVGVAELAGIEDEVEGGIVELVDTTDPSELGTAGLAKVTVGCEVGTDTGELETADD